MLVKHNFVELEKVASNRGFISAPRARVRELHSVPHQHARDFASRESARAITLASGMQSA